VRFCIFWVVSLLVWVVGISVFLIIYLLVSKTIGYEVFLLF